MLERYFKNMFTKSQAKDAEKLIRIGEIGPISYAVKFFTQKLLKILKPSKQTTSNDDQPKQPMEGKAYVVADVRLEHPNAYQPWSAEEDQQLTEFFHAGQKTKVMAKFFGRKLGAIRSRLKKLQLIEASAEINPQAHKELLKTFLHYQKHEIERKDEIK